MVFGIAADVLDRHRDFEKIPDLLYLLRRDLGRFKSVWHRKQVMGISPVHAAPAEMIRHPRRAGSLDEVLEAAQKRPCGPPPTAAHHILPHDHVSLEYHTARDPALHPIAF